MNPEENNPLANPGVPDFGMTNGQMNLPGNDLAMSDNLSMAGDSLTAAGMAAAPTMAGPLNFNQSGSVDGENNPAITPNEEPLVPAAPVPGSIGSVTSVPAAAEPMANPFAPVDSSNSMMTGAMPAPEIEPQSASYNPFAQPASSPAPAPAPTPVAPAPEQPAQSFMTPAKDTVNPAFQPTPAPMNSKKSHSMNPLTAILAIACALLLISTIVFAALFINAKNNPKVVYVPTVSGGEADSQISFLTCSRSEEMNWLINDAYTVPASHTLTLSYSNDKISAILDEHQATLATEEDANIARDIFSNANAEPVVPEVVEAIVNGNILDTSISLEGDSFTAENASIYLYGATEGVPTTSMDDVRATFEAEGYVCTVE